MNYLNSFEIIQWIIEDSKPIEDAFKKKSGPAKELKYLDEKQAQNICKNSFYFGLKFSYKKLIYSYLQSHSNKIIKIRTKRDIQMVSWM